MVAVEEAATVIERAVTLAIAALYNHLGYFLYNLIHVIP